MDGEDIFIVEYFKKKKNGFYIDVGCYHPIHRNNTYLLHKNGWSGIIIDGYVRDIEILRNIDIGIMALGSCPRKSRKEGKGEIDGIIMIDDIAVKPKQWLYADINGIIISKLSLKL